MALRADPGSLELSSGNIVGKIWIQVGTCAFPEEGWYDLPLPLIVEFVKATRSVEGGEENEETVSFYDGPFEVRFGSAGHGKLRVSLSDIRSGGTEPRGRTFELCLASWTESLLRAAWKILEECDSRGWINPDIDALRGLISDLRMTR